MSLHRYFIDAAARFGANVAVREPSGATIGYADLDRLTDRLRDRLAGIGVKRGDRVGMCLHKSIDSVACILGILKCGAAYVPVDPNAPAARNAYIFGDCSVRAIVTEAALAPALRAELGGAAGTIAIAELGGIGGGGPLRAWLDAADAASAAPAVPSVESELDELAYILYTSGSTGRPKGVMLTHRNAKCFVDWCSETFNPAPEDRFSSHAPFHFDLSILDIYTPLKHGATLVLIPEDTGKDPMALAAVIAAERLSVWYSTPSILALLAQYGKLETHDYSSLRLVLFAGEVFPVAHLRALKRLVPHPRYFNLYGPTETNVCTYYELPAAVEDDRTVPYPIGVICPHYRGIIAEPDGRETTRGSEGELLMQGPGVMKGYWNLPEQDARVFLDMAESGRWYRTGDIVAEDPGGNLLFIGRKDRMVKKRGYRVELGEIEACLYRHPNVREAAVVAPQDESEGVKIHAHLSTRDGKRISVIELKQFCSRHVPAYFIPDVFGFHDDLPKTSTDKIDYQKLQSQSGGAGAGKP